MRKPKPKLNSVRAAAWLWIAGLSALPALGQSSPIDADLFSRGPSALTFWKAYRTTPLPPLNTQNGPLLEGAIRGRELELTLTDFLRLVVENGLDLESDRY